MVETQSYPYMSMLSRVFHPPLRSFHTSFILKLHVLRIAKWQEQWEQTDSNLKRYNIDPKERLPSGHTLPWRAWRTSNRVRSGQAATPAAKHLWGYRDSKNGMCGAATCDLNNIMTSCTHFGERPSLYDIAEMKDGYVRWLRAIADTI